MFFSKTRSDASTGSNALTGPSLRLEISIPLVRRKDSDSLHDQPEWLSELTEVVDSLTDLVATFDRDGRLLMINAAGVDLLGHPPSALTQLLISDLYPEPEAEEILGNALQEALDHGSWTGCITLRNAAGETIDTYQRWVAHELHERKASAFTLVARLLDESCAESELRNRRESWVAMSLGFVHDLNNILGPITTYADLATSTIESDSPAIRYLAQIARAAERGRALSVRLAELARGREPEESAVDVLEIAREIVGWLRISRPDLIIEISTGSVATVVQGDAVQLHQVVMNLTKNAVEALSDRSGSVRLHLDHANPPGSDDAHDRFLRLSVRDTGRGIDEANLSRVFEPFFTTKDDGSGLGLHVSREIVRRHRGVLTVEPSEPNGTTVTVYLPLSSEASQSNAGVWF